MLNNVCNYLNLCFWIIQLENRNCNFRNIASSNHNKHFKLNLKCFFQFSFPYIYFSSLFRPFQTSYLRWCYRRSSHYNSSSASTEEETAKTWHAAISSSSTGVERSQSELSAPTLNRKNALFIRRHVGRMQFLHPDIVAST